MRHPQSELISINLDNISLSAEAILIRGKGKKERYVPFGDSVKSALAFYLPKRQQVLTGKKGHLPALLINQRGGRLTTRSVGASLRKLLLPRDFLRMFIPTRYVTLLARIFLKKAPTCVPSRRCLATNAFLPLRDTRSYR